ILTDPPYLPDSAWAKFILILKFVGAFKGCVATYSDIVCKFTGTNVAVAPLEKIGDPVLPTPGAVGSIIIGPGTVAPGGTTGADCELVFAQPTPIKPRAIVSMISFVVFIYLPFIRLSKK